MSISTYLCTLHKYLLLCLTIVAGLSRNYSCHKFLRRTRNLRQELNTRSALVTQYHSTIPVAVSMRLVSWSPHVTSEAPQSQYFSFEDISAIETLKSRANTVWFHQDTTRRNFISYT